jgi:uncharacterized protein YjbJ (UPF0337 family)
MSKLKTYGNWNTKKDKLKQQFAELTDEDLQYTEGKEEELIGRVQRRLDIPREIVEKIIRTT